MTNKQLGTIALAGSPAMLIGVMAEFMYKPFEDSWFTGAWGIFYITAWMCSLVVMHRREIAGSGFGKWLIRIMFITLAVANISNIVQILSPKNDPPYFFYIDLFWPLSHLLMLILGITVLFNKQLDRKSKYTLAGAGIWLPLALIPMAVFGKTIEVVFFPGLYNALLWGMMAFMAMKQNDRTENLKFARIDK